MFEKETPDAIKARILSALKTDIDRREGSFADDMAGPVALELYKMYQTLEAVQSIAWVDETSGPYLDLAAKDIGIEPRKAGTKAAVKLKITGKPGTVVPEGKLFRTEALNFRAAEAATLPESGTGELLAEAEKSGTAYNVGPEEIQYQYDNDPNITAVANFAAATGGTDAETDAALYVRIEAARKRPSTSGNGNDYERWALEVDGVGAARAKPLWNGPGSVRVLISGPDSKPVEEEVIRRCAAHIEEARPVGAVVTVLTGEELPVSIKASITAGIAAESAAERLRAGLNEYFAEIALRGTDIVYNRVGSLLMGIEGVSDYSDLTINGTAGNVTVADTQIPFVGEILLTGGTPDAV